MEALEIQKMQTLEMQKMGALAIATEMQMKKAIAVQQLARRLK